MELIIQMNGYVLLVIAALVPIANPFSTAPLFVSMTTGATKEQRRHIALLSSFYMFIVLTVFLILGSVILNFFGISMPALRIAGGLIVATIGFRMVFDHKHDNEKVGEAKTSTKDFNSIAFTPLAMPMLSGPGSISVIMSVAAKLSEIESVSNRIVGYGVVILGIAISALICWLVLRASGSVVRLLGKNGIDALTKVMGFLLVSIGVEFLVAGLRGLSIIPAI
ncbi:MAG: MarC family NAAT transporter [Alcanivoracaceae bacterium]|nr:MarC family NAAT transporter [Alcanivoracaceae bacterium]